MKVSEGTHPQSDPLCIFPSKLPALAFVTFFSSQSLVFEFCSESAYGPAVERTNTNIKTFAVYGNSTSEHARSHD